MPTLQASVARAGEFAEDPTTCIGLGEEAYLVLYERMFSERNAYLKST